MSNDKRYLFDNPRNIRLVLWFLYACCGFLLLLDFIVHRHVVHPWEGLWGFYPIYGFVGCVILVIVAKWMRTFLMRSEDYYDETEKRPPSTNHGSKDDDVNNKESDGV